jgi:hypothetical protein
MVSALVTTARPFTQAFGELLETHSEPQIDFSTCYGACGLKVPVANPQTRIRAPACKAASRIMCLVSSLLFTASHPHFVTEPSIAKFRKMIRLVLSDATQVGWWTLRSRCPS